ncbi:Glutamate/aspartate periplasmic-binding protein [Pseudomonas sp. AD21]|uniref:amino acid ABC transporter substrate-binding protein n=1 Tax=Pseudomonas sp. AD21 TaxID=396378 RepID=UPI000C84F5F1|nr:amino acid ABC transporter substrate-binding protein [Pseudomonas sp. AD21]PMQ11575.1 Glutamate/aspartate periplasmic-binding protein [Pseudomonas sp. AD21]
MKLLLASILAASTLLTGKVLAEPNSTIAKIRELGEINLGVREQTVPFSYLDDRQEYVGYSVDICKAVVDHIKRELALPTLKVNMRPVSAATRIPLLANGTIDLECASTTNNADRQKQVAFSNTIFLTSSYFASKRSNNLTEISDLKGKIITSASGTSNLVSLLTANKSMHLEARIVPAKDVSESFLMLSTGRVDAYVMDDIVLAGQIATAPQPEDFIISKDTLSPPEPYGLVMRKGDTEFKKIVDEALVAYFSSDQAVTNYKKWFEQPIPPNGVNLNFAMGQNLKNAYAHPTDSIDPSAYK